MPLVSSLRIPHSQHDNQLLQNILPPPPDIPQISHDIPPRRHVHENYDRRPFAHTTTTNVLNERVNPERIEFKQEQKPHVVKHNISRSDIIVIPEVAPPKTRGTLQSPSELLEKLNYDADIERHNPIENQDLIAYDDVKEIKNVWLN
jgi:hypothetical protein